MISEYSETNSSNNQKIIDKAKINLLHINKRNQSENIKDIKLNEVKNNLKGPKQINSNSSEQKILNFMENNWEQKFVNIIKESIKNDINKIELDVKPKNLGKIKLEVKVEKKLQKLTSLQTI